MKGSENPHHHDVASLSVLLGVEFGEGVHPPTFRLPAEIFRSVRKFIDEYRHGETDGYFRLNPFTGVFELKHTITGENLDPARNPGSVSSVRTRDLAKETLSQIFSKRHDLELHTHPDWDAKEFQMKLDGVSVPKSFYDVWSSLPSDTDLYNYVAKLMPLAVGVVSAASGGATILIPVGLKIPSRSVFYLGPRLAPLYTVKFRPIVQQVSIHAQRYGDNTQAIDTYIQTEFKPK